MRTAKECFEDLTLIPSGRIANRKLYVIFLKAEDLEREQAFDILLRLYFMVNEYRGKKPIVMHDFMRGTYMSRQYVIGQVRSKLRFYWKPYEVEVLYGEDPDG